MASHKIFTVFIVEDDPDNRLFLIEAFDFCDQSMDVRVMY